MTDRDNIIRMAREAGFAFHDNSLICIIDGLPDREIRALERLADKVIAEFLQRSDQYLTNDASREAVIADAVAEERESCATAKPPEPVGLSPILRAAYDLGVAETHAAIRARGQKSPETCWCETCRPNTPDDMRLIVCPACGNKRCPHATHHNNECTASNAPGQKGSSWENVKPAAGSRRQHD